MAPEPIDKKRVKRGICTGQSHPNRTVMAIWCPKKETFVCGGDPVCGLDACGHAVIVSAHTKGAENHG